MEVFDIYLSSAIKNVSVAEHSIWRNKAKNMLEQYESRYKVFVINPNDYFSYEEKLHKTDMQIMDYYLSRVRNSKLILLNLDHSDNSVGTGWELSAARILNIPIIGFGSKPDTWYKWDELSCQVVFNTLEDACGYIENYYL